MSLKCSLQSFRLKFWMHILSPYACYMPANVIQPHKRPIWRLLVHDTDTDGDYCAVEFLRRVHIGSVSNVSKVHAISIFRDEVSRMD
jgi:hypothetical protein